MGIGGQVSARAAFLDRDGVINRAIVRNGKPYPPTRIEEVEILPGVPDALARLKQANFRLLVVTNQPDIARGTVQSSTVDAIDDFLMRKLPLDRIYVCPHDSSAACACRKPRPGLLLKGADDFAIDLLASFMVGDRWRDIEAGHAVGCETFFIDYRYDERRPNAPDHVVASLAEAARIVLSSSSLKDSS